MPGVERRGDRTPRLVRRLQSEAAHGYDSIAMANLNKVFLIGNLTRDVETRYTQGGTAIGKLGLAVNRKYTAQNGELKEETCFVDLTAFGKQAETLAKFVGKGSPLFVEGRLNFSTWEDKDGGGKRSKLDVVIENFQFLGAPGQGKGRTTTTEEGGAEAPPRRAQGQAPAGGEQVDYGEVPF